MENDEIKKTEEEGDDSPDLPAWVLDLVGVVYEAIELEDETTPESDEYFSWSVDDMDDETRIEDYQYFLTIESAKNFEGQRLLIKELSLDHISASFEECEQAIFHYDCDGMPRFLFAGTFAGARVVLLIYPWWHNDALRRQPKK